jgi:hypothetical protein
MAAEVVFSNKANYQESYGLNGKEGAPFGASLMSIFDA